MVPPLFTSGDGSTWAPSGMDSYNGKLYVAALRGSAVLEFDLNTGEYREVITGIGRIRDVRIEDNYLYFISNNRDGRGTPQENDDKLYRISLSELN
jgi:glucose/arabinose dehydrogenase